MSAPLQMWVLLFGLLFAAKAATLIAAWRRGQPLPATRGLLYGLLWAGLDPRTFAPDSPVPAPPPRAEWLDALAKTLLGALFFFVVAPRATAPDLVRAWIATVGLGLFAFFGLCHLLALAWRRLGVPAERLWRAPLLATSPIDFWSRRWNMAFRAFAHDVIFRPLARRVGVGPATGAVFVASGLMHELVLSVPAGGGYGLPTLFFLIQLCAVLLERSALGTRLGLEDGVSGRVFTVLAVGAAAPLLFHVPFQREVVLPMIRPFSP